MNFTHVVSVFPVKVTGHPSYEWEISVKKHVRQIRPIKLPPGKHTKNYGKIHQFFMGKVTISMAVASIVFCMFTRPGTWD